MHLVQSSHIVLMFNPLICQETIERNTDFFEPPTIKGNESWFEKSGVK